MRGARLAWILAAGIVASSAAHADEPAELAPLRFDPFAERTLRSSAATSAGPFAPVLRATLISGADALANLGGRILRIGEESHGYRLVAVREGEAEFETEGGGLLVLEVVRPDDEDDDE